MDISFLFELPKHFEKALFTIEPLAPLSIVKKMPGSYYKTEYEPDKYSICGLFENILDLHFPQNERNQICKQIKKHYKKEYEIDLVIGHSAVGYQPVIDHLFNINEIKHKPIIELYNDLWTQHVRGSDSRHLNGSVNYSWQIEKDILMLKKENKVEEKDANKYFEEKKNYFPRYYRTIINREYLIANGVYEYEIEISSTLKSLLLIAIEENNIGYLGHNEGWVDIRVGEQ